MSSTPAEPTVWDVAATQDVLAQVRDERGKQEEKWGQQNWHPLEWLSILSEEVGEVGKAINEAYFGTGDWVEYRRELIQVAAVATAMVECLDRKGHPQK
jgi:NTP pyrophosphatase (non-canonical NTP hydrolase)